MIELAEDVPHIFPESERPSYERTDHAKIQEFQKEFPEATHLLVERNDKDRLNEKIWAVSKGNKLALRKLFEKDQSLSSEDGSTFQIAHTNYALSPMMTSPESDYPKIAS